jgi:hypothetical protein
MNMLRDEYLRRLIDASPIELYLSSVDGARIYWPWRMAPPKEASTKYRNACEKYIIDSDPLDDDVTTKQVLDKAITVDAEVASLQDVYLDKEATVDSLLRGVEVADDHEFGGELLLPLQPPYVECYKEIGEPTDHLIGIGGLKDGTEWERIEATKDLRSYAGNSVWIHGFGWGPTEKLAKEIRSNPDFIDSLDYTTPIQTAIKSTDMPGAERMSVQAMRAATQLVQDLRTCTHHVNESDDYENGRDESILNYQ